MEGLEIAGYVGAVIIGVVLGLIGGGGSILTVPIMVYLLKIEPVIATAYSLFVVGTASLFGAVRNAQKGMVDFRTGIVFAVPAFISVFLTRKFLVPAIPDPIFTSGEFVLSKDMGIMVFFALIMLFASISMIRGRKAKSEEVEEKVVFNYPMILLEGAVIGVVTGLIGAGGGFLIIPALVLFAKLPMKKAVATSLMIIAIKSLIGFLGDVSETPIDWPFLLTFTGLAVGGIFIGLFFNKKVDGKVLKKFFGWFVLVMGLYIVLTELGVIPAPK